jgi:hypothetical protein
MRVGRTAAALAVVATLGTTLFVATPAEANKRVRIFVEFGDEAACQAALPRYMLLGASGCSQTAATRWVIWGPWEQ